MTITTHTTVPPLDIREIEAPGTANALAVFFDDGSQAPSPARHRPNRTLRYHSAPELLVRAVHHPDVPVPTWPDFDDSSPQGVRAVCAWIRRTWRVREVADAVRQASQAFGQELDALTERTDLPDAHAARKVALSLASYYLRLQRPTPLGLFAGVVEGSFGARTNVTWREGHRAVAQADGAWMAGIVARLEEIPEIREHLMLTANNIMVVRGARLVVPWQTRATGAQTTAVREVSVRRTPQVVAVMEMAEAPIPYRDLLGKLVARGDGDQAAARDLLDELIARRVLISNLHAPATEADPLAYLVTELDRIGIPQGGESIKLVDELREIHRMMAAHNQQPAASGDSHRMTLRERMAALDPAPVPLSVEVALDGHVSLPRAAALQAEQATTLLARLSPEPYGAPAWQNYRARFLDRYGPNVLVPLSDLLDGSRGIGLPDGFHGTLPAPRPTAPRRDTSLLALAHSAVIERRDLELDEETIIQLAVGDPAAMEVPPHTELLFELHSPSVQALDAGDFELAVRGVGRGDGYFSGGRFAGLLASGPQPSALLNALAHRPTSVEGAVTAHLSFPALRAGASNIARCPQLTTNLVSLSEHRAPAPGTIALSDLAVICDGQRLHLVSLSRNQVVEAASPHPLQIECQTPWTARFIDELVRGQVARITSPTGKIQPFDWGLTAGSLPALPRVRHGRTILSPATWRLDPDDLPGRDASTAQWEDAVTHMRHRLGIPSSVQFTHYDMRLRLDLDHPGHLALLRDQMLRPKFGPIALTEAPDKDAFGWCDRRPNEVVALMRRAAPPRPAPRVAGAPVSRGTAHLPGTSPYVCSQLHCPTQERKELITNHLPALLAELGHIRWWFLPTQSPSPGLRLHLRLPNGLEPGPTIERLGRWAAQLTSTGALSDLDLVPYRPHIGRWGNGDLLQAAESCAAADSDAVARHLTRTHTVDPRVITAAHLLDIATGFGGGVDEGLRQLAARPKVPVPALSRTVRDEALRLLDPDGDWAALRALAGDAVTGGWAARRHALTAYRRLLSDQEFDADSVLEALLEDHHRRALGDPSDDGRTALYLARAAALSYGTRTASRPATGPSGSAVAVPAL